MTPEPEESLPEDITPESAEETPAGKTPAQYEEEIAKLKDQWLRAHAEADNTRKRAQREVEEGRQYAVGSFARDLVSVLENLQRALSSIPSEARSGNEMLGRLAEGVELTSNELIKAFEQQGIRRIDPLGKKFDHNFHQAVTQLDAPDSEPGTVVQVLQAGYMLHDRLLRPALVAVAKAPDVANKLDTTA